MKDCIRCGPRMSRDHQRRMKEEPLPRPLPASGRGSCEPRRPTRDPPSARVAYSCPQSLTVRSAVMNRTVRRLAAAALLLLAAPAFAAPPTDEDIRAAIKQLGDERFAVREKAMKFLMQAGATAERQLTEALGSTDPEVVKRARSLLDRILYRIEPGAPPEIVALAARYPNG